MKKQIEIDPNTNLPKLPEGDRWEVRQGHLYMAVSWATPRKHKYFGKTRFKLVAQRLFYDPDEVFKAACSLYRENMESLDMDNLTEEVSINYPPGKLDLHKQRDVYLIDTSLLTSTAKFDTLFTCPSGLSDEANQEERE